MSYVGTRPRPAASWLAVCALAAACSSGGPSLGTPIRLDEPDKSAASFSFAYYTDVVARGDQVAAAYMTLNGTQDRNVVVRQSDDGGKTWTPQFVLNAPEYGDTISVAPKLAVEKDGALVVVWQARRNRAGQKFILTRRSTDFGKSWGPIQLLNSLPQSFPPAIASSEDGTLLVAFSDERNVERDIFVNRSTDGGVTWLPKDVAVNAPAKNESLGPFPLLGSGGDAWVVWEEKTRGNPRLLISRSRDAGLTWGPARRIDPEKAAATPLWPMVVAANGRLVAVWTAGIVGETTRSWLWVSSSTDGGETWSPPTQFYEGPKQTIFQLVARGSSVYLVWSAGGSEGATGVYFNASDDGGATWRQPVDRPVRIDDPASKVSAGRPRLALAGDSTVVAVWQEEETRIVVRASKDGGRTWPSAPVTVATAEKNHVRFPIVAATEQVAWVLWEDWADMTGVRKTLADANKLTPLDVYIRKVALP